MSIDLRNLAMKELLNLDLKKLKKDELIEVIEIFKDEQKDALIRYGVKDYTEMLEVNIALIGGKTVKSVLEENDTLKKELKEKELTIKKLQKLNNEHNKMIKEIKESNGVQKIKNERGAGRKVKFSDKEIERILEERKTGTTIRNIAKLHNCSTGLIHKIISEHDKENKK